MNFPKIFKGLEGRSFLIQKFSLQMFVLKKENFGHEFREKLTIYFPKKGGGGSFVKGRLELFRKFIRFGEYTRPLPKWHKVCVRFIMWGILMHVIFIYNV